VRAGRIDATEGGPFGVPAPETDLDLTLEYFANAGFNQVDSIGLTACGTFQLLQVKFPTQPAFES